MNFAPAIAIIVLISTISLSAAASKERCGDVYGSCFSGYCCSKYDYCGKSDAHCLVSSGCQTKYGKCTGNDSGSSGTGNDKPSQPTTSTTSLKGKGRMTYYGNAGDCPSK